VPVKFAGVQINSGDFIYADNNGVIVSKKALSMPA
jgi:regulator of ribonuclease activity A